MKLKVTALFFAVACVALVSCHFGTEEAAGSLERNKTYKEKKAAEGEGPEINAEYVKGGAKPSDSTKKADSVTAQPAPVQAPAEGAHH